VNPTRHPHSVPYTLRPTSARAYLAAVALAVVAVAAGAILVRERSRGRPLLFAPTFAQQRALVTNEYATYNPAAAGAQRSPVWIVTSGSLFARNGHAWSGVPDGRTPDASSTSGTGSSVLRVVTRRRDFGNVSIRMRLRIDGLVDPASSTNNWDGVHIFARYQSPVLLYVVSVSRRDGTVLVKKKVPGTSSNGGTYIQLGRQADVAFTPGTWHDVRLDVRNVDQGVRLTLSLDGHATLDTIDRGADSPPITGAGRIGIRGDNAEFDVDDLTVRRA
jgi:hypothetical protein